MKLSAIVEWKDCVYCSASICSYAIYISCSDASWCASLIDTDTMSYDTSSSAASPRLLGRLRISESISPCRHLQAFQPITVAFVPTQPPCSPAERRYLRPTIWNSLGGIESRLHRLRRWTW